MLVQFNRNLNLNNSLEVQAWLRLIKCLRFNNALKETLVLLKTSPEIQLNSHNQVGLGWDFLEEIKVIIHYRKNNKIFKILKKSNNNNKDRRDKNNSIRLG